MKVLLLEDHNFFASDLIEYFKEDTDFDLVYVKSFKEAVEAIEKHGYFDYSILDVILQNGKTGMDIVKTFKNKIGKFMFLTGCTDQATLNTLSEYIVVSKLDIIWPKLDLFFSDKLKPNGISNLLTTII